MTTISLREIFRYQVVDSKGEPIGIVDDVLFHPVEPFAVGFSVKPTRIGGVIPLPMRYLTFAMTELNDENSIKIKIDASEKASKSSVKRQAKAAWGAQAERKTGILWDDTVIYYGQDVTTEEGTRLGKICDARFDPETGEILALQVTDGTTSDLALGKRDITGAYIRGFDAARHSVVVSNEAARIEYDGGAAQTVGKAAATAEKAAAEIVDKTAEVAGKAAEVAIQGAAKAAVYTERALKNAAKSETGRKAKNMFFSFATSFRDAMQDEHEAGSQNEKNTDNTGGKDS